MSQCFLIGSPKIAPSQHSLRVLHYIEYLTYDLDKKRVNIVADFFIKNISDDEVSLYGLHSGSIDFQNSTDNWFSDSIWTPVLLEWASDEIGLSSNGSDLLLCDSDNLFVKVELLKGPIKPYGPKPRDECGCTCFTGWQSPLVKPKTLCLFRVSGVMDGKSYDDLMPAGEDDESIWIMGGEPLEDYMKEHLLDKYREEYLKLGHQLLQAAEYYHVFFERRGGSTLKILRVSPDMIRKYVNKEFSSGRFINWCWSDSHFNIQTRANGPVLKLVTYREGTPSREAAYGLVRGRG